MLSSDGGTSNCCVTDVQNQSPSVMYVFSAVHPLRLNNKSSIKYEIFKFIVKILGMLENE